MYLLKGTWHKLTVHLHPCQGPGLLVLMGAQYCVTLFFAQRGRESVAAMQVGDLIKEESDTLQFSYWREVQNLRLLLKNE